MLCGRGCAARGPSAAPACRHDGVGDTRWAAGAGSVGRRPHRAPKKTVHFSNKYTCHITTFAKTLNGGGQSRSRPHVYALAVAPKPPKHKPRARADRRPAPRLSLLVSSSLLSLCLRDFGLRARLSGAAQINGIYITLYTQYTISRQYIFSNSEYAIMLRASRAFFLLRPLQPCTQADAAECKREREGIHAHACEKKRVLLLTYNKL